MSSLHLFFSSSPYDSLCSPWLLSSLSWWDHLGHCRFHSSVSPWYLSLTPLLYSTTHNFKHCPSGFCWCSCPCHNLPSPPLPPSSIYKLSTPSFPLLPPFPSYLSYWDFPFPFLHYPICHKISPQLFLTSWHRWHFSLFHLSSFYSYVPPASLPPSSVFSAPIIPGYSFYLFCL